ncbi:MAG TPA: VCBS repeat-containing protein, partial [Chitinophagaceae bacterium]
MQIRISHVRSYSVAVMSSLAIILFMSACRNKENLLSIVPASSSGITFANMLEEREGLNILYHINYYNGGGVSVADFNKDGLTDIYFTANSKGNNKLYLNKGNFVFEDITAKAGVAGTADWCSGSTIADVNADGFPDIYVMVVAGKLGLKGHNQLFINNGNNTFTESAAKYGLDASALGEQSAFFDYDRDGDLDCFILNQSDHPFAYIVDTSHRKEYDSLSGDRLLRNDCNTASGRFTDVSKTAGIWQSKLGYGLGLAVADLNNDGWDDIYVSNDFHENDYYYVNNGNGTFTDAGRKHFRHFSRFSMGNDIADYNNDGHLDVVTVDMLPNEEKILKTYGSDEQFDIYRQKITSNGFLPQFSKNCLQRNNGNGESFSEVSLISGVSATDWSWSPLFTDLDNDGIKDLFVTSGIPKRPVDLDYVRFISNLYVQKQMNRTTSLDKEALDKIPDGSSHPFIFQGNEDGIFTDKSMEWGTGEQKGYFNGAAWADLDNDGDVDLIVNSINAP